MFQLSLEISQEPQILIKKWSQPDWCPLRHHQNSQKNMKWLTKHRKIWTPWTKQGRGQELNVHLTPPTSVHKSCYPNPEGVLVVHLAVNPCLPPPAQCQWWASHTSCEQAWVQGFAFSCLWLATGCALRQWHRAGVHYSLTKPLEALSDVCFLISSMYSPKKNVKCGFFMTKPLLAGKRYHGCNCQLSNRK